MVALSAGAFIFVILAIIGLCMSIYYAVQCLPVLLEKKSYPTIDPERNNLLATNPDKNHNEALPSAPTDELAVENEVSYPVISNTLRAIHEDDSLENAADHSSPGRAMNGNGLDTPDHGARNTRSDHDAIEMEARPLLHGDDEDGLCPADIRKKNCAPLTNYDPDIPVNGAEVPSDDHSYSEITGISQSTPIKKLRDAEDSSFPDDGSSTLKIAQTVPPEQNMSDTHPPSHVIVTVPKPLNAPPLMVAPIYDEPAIDDVPNVSLHQQLQPIGFVRSNSSEEQPAPKEIKVSNNSPGDANYGWEETVTKHHKDENESDKLAENEEPKASESEPLSSEKSKPKNETKEENNEKVNEGHSTDSLTDEGCPSKEHSVDGSDTSEPEVNEYNFETGYLVPSTNSVLADELSTVSSVKITNIRPLPDAAEADDSTRVQVGDSVLDCDVSVPDTGSGSENDLKKENDDSPDLTIPRRSPDGDSMKSLEAEQPKTASNETPKPKEISAIEGTEV